MTCRSTPDDSQRPTPARTLLIAAAAGGLLVTVVMFGLSQLRVAPWNDASPASAHQPETARRSPPPPPNSPPPPPASSTSPINSPIPGKTFYAPAGRSPLAQSGEKLQSPLSPSDLKSSDLPQSHDADQPMAKTTDSPSPFEPAPPTATAAKKKKSPPPASLPPGVISWQQAASHIGQTVTIQGKVTQTYLSTKDQVCFLNFTSKRQGAFYVIIFQEALGVWETAPDELFKGKTVQVTGTIFQHGDRTQIRVYEKEQIKIVRP